MVDRLEERGLELARDVQNAEAAPTETAGTIDAQMNEGRHQPACTGAANPARRWHQIEIADALHEARIGLLLSGEQNLCLRE